MKVKVLLGLSLALGMLAPMAAQAQLTPFVNDVHANNSVPQATRFQSMEPSMINADMTAGKQTMIETISTGPHMLMNLRNNTDMTQHFKVSELGIDYTLAPRSVGTLHLDTSGITHNVQYRFETDQGQQTASGTIPAMCADCNSSMR